MSCFDSVLFDENEPITKEKLEKLKEILKSEYCTIRYQYVRPSINPIRGGNKSKLILKNYRANKLMVLKCGCFNQLIEQKIYLA